MNDQWTNRLSEYLDGTLALNETAALDAHLAGCAACRATLDELKRVVARARALEDRPPAADLWAGIAQRIGVSSGQPVVSLAERRAGGARRRLVFSVPQAMAAGVALMILSGGAAWLSLRPRATSTATTTPAFTQPAPGPGAGRTATWVPEGSRNYETAIQDLQQALDRGRGQLDSATVRKLEQSLATIDRAIAQAQAALAADTSDTYLYHHYTETMQRKLELLKRANAIVAARS
jgi:putative zinc finger protein